MRRVGFTALTGYIAFSLAGAALSILVLMALSHGYIRWELTQKSQAFVEANQTIQVLQQANRDRDKAIARLQTDTARLKAQIHELEALGEQVNQLLSRAVNLQNQVSRTSGGRAALGGVRRQSERILGSRGFAGIRRQDAAPPLPAASSAPGNLQRIQQSVTQTRHALTGIQAALSDYYDRLQRIPSIWPVAGRIASRFGDRTHPILGGERFHEGVDISCPSGTPVAVAAEGVVSFAGWQGGYGYLVRVDHGNGYETRYAHLSRILVRPRQWLNKGETLGLAGTTGLSTGPHLHYEVWAGGQVVNPVFYLP